MSSDSQPRAPYDWDPDKAKTNYDKLGVEFEAVYDFDWAGAIEAEDTRYDYGEVRMQALGKIGNRYHVLVYAQRGNALQVISLRRANRRELP